MSVSVMVLVPLAPCVTLTLPGEADNEKSGCGTELTVRLMVVVCVRVPLVPVIVTVAGPVVAVLLAVNVSVLVEVVGLGLNDAVTPEGNPDADKVTLPVKPLRSVSVMVLVPLEPCVTLTLPGEADSEKSAEPLEPVNCTSLRIQ